ncbi:hypothetical protein MC885_001733, partial [Smutsia gigantea]
EINLKIGEIHISLINGRPSADDPSPDLLEFTSARYIRLRFQRIRTLNADLMMFAHKDPREIDPIVTRRYYYSVKDISVGGMCICYGHARACPLDPVSPNYPRPCQSCHCDPVGSLNEVCVKDEKLARRGLAPGSCHCRPGFRGVSCDRCARGYMGYPDCKPCNCSSAGSTNEDPCFGPCNCKENVEGGDCSRCRSGFFNLQEDNRKGCDECFCSGVSNRCQSSYWTYGNIQDMSGWYLTDISGSIQVAPQQDGLDPPRQISVGRAEAPPALRQSYYWSAPAPYLGNKVNLYSA